MCPGTNFLLHEFHQNIITLIFLQTFLIYMKTHAILCRPNFKDYYRDYIFFSNTIHMFMTCLSIARKAMPLREDWLWNKTLCICYFYWCSINKFLGIFMTWYLRYTFHNQCHHTKHFDMIGLRATCSTHY